jgi:hypothetical protein
VSTHRDLPPRACAHCGATFTPRHPAREFCGEDRCTYERRKKREAVAPMRKWAVTWGGMTSVIEASSRGQARAMAANTLAGYWGAERFESWREMTCRLARR